MSSPMSESKPLAAIWWRVSTDHQEQSPDTQRSEAKKLLESEGFHVPEAYIFGANWSSEEIMDCPEMQTLMDTIQSGVIQALGVYHPDRLAAKPGDRLVLRTLCDQKHVRLMPCNGQIHDGPEGEFLDFAVTWAKYQQVLRAQQSSKDGLRARATSKGLRPSGRPPTGYDYAVTPNANGESGKDHMRLVANKDWSLMNRIWRQYLAGQSIHSIVKMFRADGIPSPKGKPSWDVSSIAQMLKNPLYAGRPFGFRYKAVRPINRTSPTTYGKSSMADNPAEEWIPLDVKVEPPVVTWEEYQEVQDRLKANQKYSPRNAKNKYLLRGLMVCEVHGGSYHGRHPVYVCSAYRPGHTSPSPCKRYIYAPPLEQEIWKLATYILSQPEAILGALEEREMSQGTTEAAVEDSLRRVERKLEANRQAEVRLVDLYVRGEINVEIYRRNQANLKAEQVWCGEEIVRLEAQLENVRQRFVTVEQVDALRERLGERLDSANFEDRRFVLEGLETQLSVSSEGSIKVCFAIPADMDFVLTIPGKCLLPPGLRIRPVR